MMRPLNLHYALARPHVHTEILMNTIGVPIQICIKVIRYSFKTAFAVA